MQRRWLAWLGVVLGAALPLGAARADEPPPDGYVERCTLDKTCPLGQECVLCPADYRDYSRSPGVCESNLGSLGFKRQCKSWGASVWDEVWCRPVSGEADASVTIEAPDAGTHSDPRFGKSTPIVVCKPGAQSSDDGCALAGGADARGTTAVALVWLVVALQRWGRRKRVTRA